MDTARLFILEDDPLQLFSLRKLLESLGHQVVGMAATVEEGVQALETLRDKGERADLFLLDIHLVRGGDGISFLRTLPAELRSPHIFITAYNDESHFQRALETNPAGFILKPYTKHTLDYQIQVALRNIKLEQEIERTRTSLTSLISVCNRSRTLDALARDFLKELREGFGVTSAGLFLISPEGRLFLAGGESVLVGDFLQVAQPELCRWMEEFPKKGKLVAIGSARYEEVGKFSVRSAEKKACLIVPIHHSVEKEATLAGLLTVVCPEMNTGNYSKVELIELAALQAGMAIDRIQNQQTLEQTNKELEIRNRVLEALGNAFRSTDFLPVALKVLVEKLDVDGGMVHTHDDKEGVLKLSCSVGVAEEARKDFDILPIQATIIGQIAQGGYALGIDEVSSEAGRLPDSALRGGWRSLLVAPLRRENKLYGVITLASKREGAVDSFSLRVLSVISNHISIALENVYLYQRTLTLNQELEQRVKDRTEDLNTLARLSQQLTFVVGYREFFSLLFSVLHSVTRFGLAATCFFQEGKRVVFLYPALTLEQGCWERAREKIEGHVLSVTENQVLLRDEDFHLLKPEPGGREPVRLGSLHVEPFWQNYGKEPVQGYLYFFALEGKPFQERETHLFSIVAHHTSLMVQSLEYRIGVERKRLEQIVTGLPDGLLIFDQDRNLVVQNAKAENLLREASQYDTTIGLLERIKDLPFSREIRVLEIGTGKKLFLQVSSEPIQEGPDAGGFIVLLRDVTMERLREEQIHSQERLAAVGQLAAGIAHDFNNILTGIIGYAEYLQIRKDVTQESRLYLVKIIEQAKRAGALVQQILDFSRKSLAEHKPFDLVPFLKEMAKLFSRLIPENIKTEWSIKEKSCVIEGNPVQIQQILTNLLVNSRDAMPEGGILEVLVDTIPMDGDPRAKETYASNPVPSGRLVRIRVRDSGTGIPPDILPRVFEPFFTTKPVGKGTGLGLAQVYGLVQQHKGVVYVESEVGKGTQVTILLPLVGERDALEQETLSLELPESSTGQILYVEDEEAVREVAVNFLSEMGYKVLSATNGREGWELFKSHQGEIELVISDVVMPEMDGRELVRRIKQCAPRVKIILTTGYPLGAEKEEESLPKVEEVLRKPLQVVDLVRAIERIKAQA